MLFASNISKAYSERTLFSGLSLSMSAGDRIALIGANGSGKTTILDILNGDSLPDAGSISGRRNTTVGYLKQEPPPFAGRSLLEEVLNANPGETQEQEDGLSQMRQAQDAGIYCCPTLGGVLIIFPYLSYSYLTVST